MHLFFLRRILWSCVTFGTVFLAALLILLANLSWSPALLAQGETPLTVTLDLQDNPTTVNAGDVITQRIQLRYNGVNNIDAAFIQELPAGVRPIALPVITEQPPQSVTPLTLERRGRTWGWKGKMKPESLLNVVAVMRVQQCYGDDRTLTFAVSARRTPSGPALTDSATVTVACPDQSIADIRVEDAIIYPDGTVSAGSDGAPQAAAGDAITAVGRFYLPGTQPTLRITLRNDGSGPLTIGTSGAAKCCTCLTCTVAANVYREDLATVDDPTFRRFLLQPGESQILEQPMTGAPTINDPGDDGEYSYGGQITYCLLTDGDDACPEPGANPQLAAVHLINIPVRPNDLGDAPDSTNHTPGAAGAIPAYAGVPGNFPTVFDPTTGPEQGPRHLHPQFLHLGKRVSREAEADGGPDQDPLNNIVPTADDPDNDRGDDGTNLARWSLQHCQRAQVPVQIYISPAAAAWFQQQGAKAYLNGWLDSNRDGDWADAATCQDGSGQAQTTVEHIIIDHGVDVATLGAGLHTITVPTGIVNWPADGAQRPAWLRLTLSERVANKPLSAGSLAYGDGRGYAKAFRTGETEDYLLRGGAEAGGAPDLEVKIDGVLEERETPAELTAAQASSLVVDFSVRFRIDYSNLGDNTANNALLEFQIPEKLRGAQPAFVHAPGIAPNKIKFGTGIISFGLPNLAMGDLGTIIVGWTGCLTCTLTANVTAADLAAPTAEFDAAATVNVEGDSNGANDSATARPRRTIMGAGIGGFYTNNAAAWRQQGVTCQDTVTFAGRARPGMTVLLQIDNLSMPSAATEELTAAALTKHFTSLAVPVEVGANGIWRYTLSDLHDGSYRASVSYQPNGLHAASTQTIDFDRGYLSPAVYVTVDPSLTVDPMSFQLTDIQGRTYYPPVTSRLGNFEIQDFMVREPGEYTASAIACPNQLIETLQFKVGDILVDAAPAADDCQPRGSDQCGPWSAKVVVPDTVGRAASAAGAGSNSFAILAATATMDDSFSGALAAGTAGVVSDGGGTPVGDVTVTLFTAVTTSSTDGNGATTTSRFFTPWIGSDYGQSNPLTTANDGTYSFTAPDGTYRVRAERNGYQPYVTTAFEHSEGALIADDIQLSPTIGAEADVVIEVSESGFSPATLTVAPGSIIAFVNVDFADHSSNSSAWDSGILTPGAVYKVQLDTEQTYLYGDTSNPLSAGAIIVSTEAPATENQIFLPVVVR